MIGKLVFNLTALTACGRFLFAAPGKSGCQDRQTGCGHHFHQLPRFHRFPPCSTLARPLYTVFTKAIQKEPLPDLLQQGRWFAVPPYHCTLGLVTHPQRLTLGDSTLQIRSLQVRSMPYQHRLAPPGGSLGLIVHAIPDHDFCLLKKV